MKITNQEREQLAQFYFNKCFTAHYYIDGISSFYEILNNESIYKDGNSEKLGSYKELHYFHCFAIKDMRKETFIKIVSETVNCFKLMGYSVDDSNIIECYAK